MTKKELTAIKNRINQTLLKRNGIGNVSKYAGKEYDLPEFKDGDPLTKEIGEKTIDGLKKSTWSEEFECHSAHMVAGAKIYVNAVCY